MPQKVLVFVRYPEGTVGRRDERIVTKTRPTGREIFLLRGGGRKGTVVRHFKKIEGGQRRQRRAS